VTDIGYARVSTRDQNLGLQLDALRKAGCDGRIYQDEGVSGKLTTRPQLDKCIAAVSPGDTLVVLKLDRLGRSLQHLVTVVNELKERGVGFRSLTENIDTTTNSGRLIFHIFAALAEFERGLIIERTMAGLDTARANGKVGGRRPALTPTRAKLALHMLDEGEKVADVARAFSVSRATIYRLAEGEL
jgi:DNA invertase Pin-like site-specific DNA recombinase